jgi:N-acetylglucosamine-6-phosphate deacetylase
VNEAEWRMVAQRLPETGTTAFVPTFITAPLPQLTDALKAAAHLTEQLATAPDTAHILGIHVEGPFINPVRGGAHNHEWMTDPTPQKVTALIDAAQGHLEIITLAPERPGALDAIRQLTQQNILVSVGHSDALARQVAEAADAGARMVTHLFNGQRPLHHREPGVVGQALADPRLTSGLIADLRHVVAGACALAFAAAPGRIAIVTDAASCAGMPPGTYLLGAEPIELLPRDGQQPGAGWPAGGTEPPVRPDGTLAGSVLRMDAGVANMVAAGVGLVAAVAAASRVPADLIGRPDLGRIAPGAAADLAWLGDDLRAMATWVRGERLYPVR